MVASGVVVGLNIVDEAHVVSLVVVNVDVGGSYVVLLSDVVVQGVDVI